MAKNLVTSLTEALEPAVASAGYELVAVEVGGSSGRPTVRVFLDCPGGIDLDAITEANGIVSPLIDEIIPGAYTLEVSSPGIERPLVKIADFERFTGEEATVRTARPIEGRANFTGRITGVEGDTIVLDVDGTTYRIPHDAVSKARLRAEIDFG